MKTISKNKYICILLIACLYGTNVKAQIMRQDDTNKKAYEFLFGGSVTLLGDKDAPSTQLARLNSLTPLVSDDEETSAQRESHTGMVVYNTTQGNKLCPGLYMWMGTRWQQLQPPPETVETNTTLSDVDGNVYPIAKFGVAGVWMTENLRVTRTPCGHPMIQATAPDYTSMRFAYPHSISAFPNQANDGLSREEFDRQVSIGLLYNWVASTNNEVGRAKEEGTQVNALIQGICPQGWHIPTDLDWSILEAEIHNNPQQYSDYKESFTPSRWDTKWNTEIDTYRGSNIIIDGAIAGHGRAMLSQTRSVGKALPTNGKSKKSTENGFNALYAGFVNSGSLKGYGDYANFWSSSNASNDSAWIRSLYRGNSGVERYPVNMRTMQSIRCKKD